MIVANTHLFRDSGFTYVELFQLNEFSQELELVLLSHRLGARVPAIIGGDLNLQPPSSVYEHFSTGLVL